MNIQPRLQGELINVRPLYVTDFDDLFLAASDPLIWEQHPQPDRYQRPTFEQFFKDAIESKGALAISDEITSKIIGTSRYYEYSAQQSRVIIGYTFLARSNWGGAYNRELKRLMLDHAFHYVETVLFHVGERNIRSQKALLKIGATFSEQIVKTLQTGVIQKTDIFRITRKSLKLSE
jgi:RimJ/RimL family protein N-acetyltransferase